jgi:hypothetical protein
MMHPQGAPLRLLRAGVGQAHCAGVQQALGMLHAEAFVGSAATRWDSSVIVQRNGDMDCMMCMYTGMFGYFVPLGSVVRFSGVRL